MKTHTPLPWKFKLTHQMCNDTWYVITDADGYGPIFEIGGKDKNGQIAEAKYLITDPEEITANAELIVEAVNNYYPMQKRIKELEEKLAENDKKFKGILQEFDKIDNLLSKLEKIK